MIKRGIDQLAEYVINKETEEVSLSCLHRLYLEKASEIVYIIKDKKLYGIVCLGDVLRCGVSKTVRINKEFAVLREFNIVKAHEIFQRKRNIHKIPVVNDRGELLGDYSRWDDLLFIERNRRYMMLHKNSLKKIFKVYESIYVVKPVESKMGDWLKLIECLEDCGIQYSLLKKEQISSKLREKAICIFLDEDERRSMQCIYRIPLFEYDIHGNNIRKYDRYMDSRWEMRLATYKSLLFQMIEEDDIERLRLEGYEWVSSGKTDEKAAFLLSRLQKNGINCYCLYENEERISSYGDYFLQGSKEKKLRSFEGELGWTLTMNEGMINEKFYGELLENEDYVKEIAQKEICDSFYSFEYKKSITGQYFNAENGRRVTCYQPKEYIGTVYLLGPCMIVGAYVEDQYTIGSYLQQKLLANGYNYRVINLGSVVRFDSAIDSRLGMIDEYYENDIVIYLSSIGNVPTVQGCSLERIFEKNQIPVGWVTDRYLHCNHKANNVVAESIYSMIESSLMNVGVDDRKKMKGDIEAAMTDYVGRKYLDKYFSDFSGWIYDTVGAIVINGNPFSKGHRYLIEKARNQVEFLIVFVVEEDVSLFPFEERYKLIKEGTKDLNNIMIVPSGEFILSRNNFNQYFLKLNKEITSLNAEYDIEVFADYIARPLHITHRFAGEEPEDEVTAVYNQAMQKILPKRGISFVEIPRLMTENEIISASSVRCHLKSGENDKAYALLPETTKAYLQNQS